MKDDFDSLVRDVAIKRINDNEFDKGMAKREKRHLLKLLPHPNVIQYLAAVSYLYLYKYENVCWTANDHSLKVKDIN